MTTNITTGVTITSVVNDTVSRFQIAPLLGAQREAMALAIKVCDPFQSLGGDRAHCIASKIIDAGHI